MEALVQSAIEWGVAAATLPGESHSGDHYVVASFSGGLLISVLDGIGHGEQAAAASRMAGAILEKRALDPVIALVRRCHQELRDTRGVVMSIASFHLVHGLMTWLGVGNVHGVLLRGGRGFPPVEESLLLRAGVVGNQLPALQAAVLPVNAGDAVVFATDGVDSGFERPLALQHSPQKASEEILARHGKMTDDALVLVVRYWGNSR
jgi:serine phosphatase RsbU (regulator of sigma subunit)